MTKKMVISLNLQDKKEKELLNKIDKLEKDIKSGKIKNVKQKIKELMSKIKLPTSDKDKEKRGEHKKHGKDFGEKETISGAFNQSLDDIN